MKYFVSIAMAQELYQFGVPEEQVEFVKPDGTPAEDGDFGAPF
jgi:hypothetical protein